MKNFYKYLFLLILGIILYILLNSRDSFSVGNPAIYTKRDPDDRNIYYTPGTVPENHKDYINLTGTGITPLNNTITMPLEQFTELLDIAGIQGNNPFTRLRRGSPGDNVNIPIMRDEQQGGGGMDLPHPHPQAPGAGGRDLGLSPPGDPRGGSSGIWDRLQSAVGGAATACSALVSRVTYMEVAVQMREYILFTYIEEDGRFIESLDYRENRIPFTRAISYTLEYNDVPLFYTASRFYFTIIHLIRNGSIDDLTINEPSDDTTIGSSTRFSMLGLGNSNSNTGVFSVSTSLGDLDLHESAMGYYFHRDHTSSDELQGPDNLRSFIISHIPDSTDPTERTRIEGIINSLTSTVLESRVLIVLKPKSDNTDRIDDLLENTVRITRPYGRFPSRTTRQNIISLNQDLQNQIDDSTQARLLYRNTEWEAIVFLSETQQAIINSFGL